MKAFLHTVRKMFKGPPGCLPILAVIRDGC